MFFEIFFVVNENGSWKYTVDATRSNHLLFKVLEQATTLLQLVCLLIL